jgi:hypothetical protein
MKSGDRRPSWLRHARQTGYDVGRWVLGLDNLCLVLQFNITDKGHPTEVHRGTFEPKAGSTSADYCGGNTAS